MNTITVKIDGMMCGMCESHINDTIRKIYPKAKKISSSHKKGEATFIIDGDVDEMLIKKAVDDTGDKYIATETQPYKKKGLFGK